MPTPATFALPRGIQAAIGRVVVAADSAAIGDSSALPLIHLDAARYGRRHRRGH